MTSISTATLLSLAALLCACAITSIDQVLSAPETQEVLQEASQDLPDSSSTSLSCTRRCVSACSHYWWGRDLSCQFTCEAVCAPTVGVSTPCVEAQQVDTEVGSARGSTHAACWRQCATGCRGLFAPRGASEGGSEEGNKGANDRDICRDICLRFLNTD